MGRSQSDTLTVGSESEGAKGVHTFYSRFPVQTWQAAIDDL